MQIGRRKVLFSIRNWNNASTRSNWTLRRRAFTVSAPDWPDGPMAGRSLFVNATAELGRFVDGDAMESPPAHQSAPEILMHLLRLFPQPDVTVSGGREQRLDAFRVNSDLLSNLRRSGSVPKPHHFLAMTQRFPLTMGGAFKIFGFDLDRWREYDQLLHGQRTRFVESSARLGMAHRHNDWPVSEPIHPAPHPSTPAPNSAPNRPGMAS